MMTVEYQESSSEEDLEFDEELGDKLGLDLGQEADPLSDPYKPYTLQYEHVVEAATKMKNELPVTPCLPSNHQEKFVVKVYYKLENLHATGSFKERGMLFTLLKLTEKPKTPKTATVGLKKVAQTELAAKAPKPKGVVVASVGNQALSLCYHAKRMEIPVIVVMPSGVPIVRVQRCETLKAKVIIKGDNILQAQQYALAVARENKYVYINSRDHPNSLAGHGTVALEILDQVPIVDAVLVPAGSGGLLAAVATVIKHRKPECLVYGVVPEAVLALRSSLTSGRLRRVPPEPTIADAVAMPYVGVNAFGTLQPLVDKMVPVTEVSIARAILHMYEAERLVVEGAGACPLATIFGCLVPELLTKTVVCIVTGGNIDLVVLTRCLDIGRAAENRLVKFRVRLIDNPAELLRLLRLLDKGGFCLNRHFRHGQWVEGDQQLVEMSIVVETKGLEHTRDLKTYVHAAYPGRAEFENEEPKRIIKCDCYFKHKEKINYFS